MDPVPADRQFFLGMKRIGGYEVMYCVPEYPDPRFSFSHQLAMTAGMDGGGASMLPSDPVSEPSEEYSSELETWDSTMVDIES